MYIVAYRAIGSVIIDAVKDITGSSYHLINSLYSMAFFGVSMFIFKYCCKDIHTHDNDNIPLIVWNKTDINCQLYKIVFCTQMIAETFVASNNAATTPSDALSLRMTPFTFW